ncbi:MAG: hypothetical protein ABIH59_00920 [archaeon]
MKRGTLKKQSYLCEDCKRIFVLGDNRKGREIIPKEVIDKSKKLLKKRRSNDKKLKEHMSKSQTHIKHLSRLLKNNRKAGRPMIANIYFKKIYEIYKNSSVFFNKYKPLTYKEIQSELEKEFPNQKKVPSISTLSILNKNL